MRLCVRACARARVCVVCVCVISWGFWGGFWCNEYHMDLYKGFVFVLLDKTFDVGYNMQTSQPIYFKPAKLLDTTDFYHFKQLSLTLTMPGGLKVSANQNLLFSFSCTFQLIRIKRSIALKQIKLNIVILFLSSINERRETTAVLLTASVVSRSMAGMKKELSEKWACIRTLVNRFESNSLR